MDLHTLAVTTAIAVSKWCEQERAYGFSMGEEQPYISYAFYEFAPAPPN